MHSNVMSARIRLARNLRGIPFPGRMTAEQKKDVCRRVKEAAMSLPGYRFDYLDMENLTAIQAGSMVEEHLISVDFCSEREGEGLLLDRKNNISIMINEEDHLRIQVLGDGDSLRELYEKANRLDDELDEKLTFAFSDTLGYLTHCPTNLGTGLRASVMMHLPALTESGLIQKIVNTVSQVGLTVRGLYGEGSRADGCFYQVSNQVSLGISEQDTVERLSEVVRQICENEEMLRNKMMENITIEDRVFRSYGVLKEARLLSSKEFAGLISDVRLGAEAGKIPLSTDVIDKLFIRVQPYSLMLGGGDGMEIRQRDIKRAELVREKLK